MEEIGGHNYCFFVGPLTEVERSQQAKLKVLYSVHFLVIINNIAPQEENEMHHEWQLLKHPYPFGLGPLVIMLSINFYVFSFIFNLFQVPPFCTIYSISLNYAHKL